MMNKNETEHYRKLLLDLRSKILQKLEKTGQDLSSNLKDASGEISSYSFHLADMGTDTMERELSFWEASLDTKLLHEIDYALEKIEKGTYGLCESCHQPISRKRLEAIPHATLCVDCKVNTEINQI